MVIDSSALLAILQGEPEADAFVQRMADATAIFVGAPTLFETSMITLSRRGDIGLAELNALFTDAHVTTVPLNERHAALALEAFRRFGKGRHRAGLNYGDCMSYALAQATGLPLLFKGDDFVHTDVRSAV